MSRAGFGVDGHSVKLTRTNQNYANDHRHHSRPIHRHSLLTRRARRSNGAGLNQNAGLNNINDTTINDTMKLLELIMVLALGALIAGAMLYGLELSDAAQDKQQATWHIAN